MGAAVLLNCMETICTVKSLSHTIERKFDFINCFILIPYHNNHHHCHHNRKIQIPLNSPSESVSVSVFSTFEDCCSNCLCSSLKKQNWKKIIIKKN